jgi:hypothetical protein
VCIQLVILDSMFTSFCCYRCVVMAVTPKKKKETNCEVPNSNQFLEEPKLRF